MENGQYYSFPVIEIRKLNLVHLIMTYKISLSLIYIQTLILTTNLHQSNIQLDESCLQSHFAKEAFLEEIQTFLKSNFQDMEKEKIDDIFSSFSNEIEKIKFTEKTTEEIFHILFAKIKNKLIKNKPFYRYKASKGGIKKTKYYKELKKNFKKNLEGKIEKKELNLSNEELSNMIEYSPDMELRDLEENEFDEDSDEIEAEGLLEKYDRLKDNKDRIIGNSKEITKATKIIKRYEKELSVLKEFREKLEEIKGKNLEESMKAYKNIHDNMKNPHPEEEIKKLNDEKDKLDEEIKEDKNNLKISNNSLKSLKSDSVERIKNSKKMKKELKILKLTNKKRLNDGDSEVDQNSEISLQNKIDQNNQILADIESNIGEEKIKNEELENEVKEKEKKSNKLNFQIEKRESENIIATQLIMIAISTYANLQKIKIGINDSEAESLKQNSIEEVKNLENQAQMIIDAKISLIEANKESQNIEHSEIQNKEKELKEITHKENEVIGPYTKSVISQIKQDYEEVKEDEIDKQQPFEEGDKDKKEENNKGVENKGLENEGESKWRLTILWVIVGILILAIVASLFFFSNKSAE